MGAKRNVSLLILFDNEKRILLQHRAENLKRLPGYWGFFGGGIEKEETPEQALIREIKEELDYTPDDYKFLFEQNLSNDKEAGDTREVNIYLLKNINLKIFIKL